MEIFPGSDPRAFVCILSGKEINGQPTSEIKEQIEICILVTVASVSISDTELNYCHVDVTSVEPQHLFGTFSTTGCSFSCIYLIEATEILSTLKLKEGSRLFCLMRKY